MIRRPVTVLLAICTGLAGLPTVVRLLGDHGRLPLVLLAVALPYAALVLVLLLPVQLLLRRRRVALVTALLLALDALWIGPLYVAAGVPHGQPLTALTANLRYGEADPFALVRLVQSHHVDLLATEELTPEAQVNLRGAGLDAELPYFVGDPGRGPDGCGLWSRYPLSPQPEWDQRFRAPGAVVHVPGHDVLVRVMHAYPPVGDEHGQYQRDYARLTANVRRLPAALPTVLMGDFNATLDNSLLRDLMGSRFRDASEKAGSGLVRTWGMQVGGITVLDLDHIFVDHRIGVRSTTVLDLPRSDHDGLLARLVLS